MKYLRRIFEEVNQNEYEQLKDFCEMYLAYLLDDDNILIGSFIIFPI